MNINKDWFEDSSLENGKYLNQCLSCREIFTGHKRRTYCKECDNMNPPTLPEYIKPGAFVKLRDGSKARIYATDGGPSPYNVHGAIWIDDHWDPREWAGYQYTMEPNHNRDIIGPWTDKPNCDKLWSLLPPWIKYLAMDKDYGWFGYTLKPLLGNFHAWNVIEDEYCFKIPSEHVPIYSGDWKDSLVERPE